jgi:hypothetical protein
LSTSYKLLGIADMDDQNYWRRSHHILRTVNDEMQVTTYGEPHLGVGIVTSAATLRARYFDRIRRISDIMNNPYLHQISAYQVDIVRETSIKIEADVVDFANERGFWRFTITCEKTRPAHTISHSTWLLPCSRPGFREVCRHEAAESFRM